MTTTTLTNHKSETQLTTAEVALVSTSSSEKKYLGMFSVTNTSESTVDVTFWRIGDSVTGVEGVGGNWIFSKGIAAKESVRMDKIMGHMLGNSMKISGKAEVAAVINIDISGTTEV